MEAARRIDEWERIRKHIPNYGIVLIPVEGSEPAGEDAKFEYKAEDINRVLEIVDGQRTASHICAESPFSDFTTCKILSILAGYGQVRTLTKEETVDLGGYHAASGDLKQAADLYESALVESPNDLKLHNHLAETLEALEKTSEAAREYISTGLIHQSDGNIEHALLCFRKASELAPRNFAAHQHLYELHVAQNEYDEAVKEALLLAKAYEQIGRAQESKEILEKTIELVPDSFEVKALLADVFLNLDEKEAGIQNLEELASLYMSRKMHAQAAAVLRKILMADKTRKDVHGRLGQVQAILSSKKHRRSAGTTVAFIAVIIILLALLAGGYYYETGVVRSKFKIITSEVNNLVTEADRLAERAKEADPEAENLEKTLDALRTFIVLGTTGTFPQTAVPAADFIANNGKFLEKLIERNIIYTLRAQVSGSTARSAPSTSRASSTPSRPDKFEDALKTLNDFKINYKVSLLVMTTPKVDEQIERVKNARRKLEKAYEDARKEKTRTQWNTFRRGKTFALRGKPREAIETYRMVALRHLSRAQQRTVKQAMQKALDYLGGARNLARLAARHEKASELKLAREVLKDLASAYPNSEEAWAVTYPILITTNPPGAEVEINGKKIEDAQTPYVHRLDDYNDRITVTVSLRTYDTKTEDATGLSEIFIRLKKRPFKTVKISSGLIESAPAIIGSIAYIGTTSGSVYSVDIADPRSEPKKLFTANEPLARFSSKPRIAGNLLLLGSHNRMLYAIDRTYTGSTGQNAHWKLKLGNYIMGAPSKPNAEDTVFIGACDGKLYAVEIKGNGRILWTLPGDEPADSGSGAEDKPGNGPESTARPAPSTSETDFGEIESGPVLFGAYVIFGSANGKLHCVNTTTQKVNWAFQTDGRITATALIHGGSVFIGSENGTFYCVDATTGNEKWHFETGGKVTGAAVSCEDVIYFGSHDGNVYTLEASTGKKVWSFDTGGAISGSPALGGDILYVGSESRRFFALKVKSASEKGETSWEYKTNGPIKGGVALSGKWVVFPSKSTLFCFER
jgi:outer membrane protein assembly factor BamB/cytochrome c-type biogenesis protein CcmH/NrfG